MDEKTLIELIKKYSEFINFPIKLKVYKEITTEVTDDEETDGEGKSEDEEEKAPKLDDIEEGEGEDEFSKEPKKKTK